MGKVISIVNQKGGVGKTTITLSLATALHRMGKKCLMVDLDAQANLTRMAGFKRKADREVFINEFLDSQEYVNAVQTTPEGLDMLCSDLDLANVEYGMSRIPNVKEAAQILSHCLSKIKKSYDYIFLDCAPTIGMMFTNILFASDLLIVPIANVSANSVKDNLRKLKERFGLTVPEYYLSTIVDMRRSVDKILADQLAAANPDNTFETRIRSNAVYGKAECACHSIYAEDSKSIGAQDFDELAKEFLTIVEKMK